MRKALDDGVALPGIGIQKYPVPNKVKFTVSRIQLKISRHTKKQKNITIKRRKINQTKLTQTNTDVRISRRH